MYCPVTLLCVDKYIVYFLCINIFSISCFVYFFMFPAPQYFFSPFFSEVPFRFLFRLLFTLFRLFVSLSSSASFSPPCIYHSQFFYSLSFYSTPLLTFYFQFPLSTLYSYSFTLSPLFVSLFRSFSHYHSLLCSLMTEYSLLKAFI